jgi:hypothetical protein
LASARTTPTPHLRQPTSPTPTVLPALDLNANELAPRLSVRAGHSGPVIDVWAARAARVQLQPPKCRSWRSRRRATGLELAEPLDARAVVAALVQVVTTAKAPVMASQVSSTGWAQVRGRPSSAASRRSRSPGPAASSGGVRLDRSFVGPAAGAAVDHRTADAGGPGATLSS